MTVSSKITLVGAGPGGTDLISLRGLKALAKADIVLYDALVSEELLQYCPQAVQKIYVGKRANKHAYSQDQINEMLVKYALSHGHVVRLKGGDPFVFGRGYEEIEFAHKNNIETEVIPGISSAIGVPSLQGIPITHRGTTESFWVITGTTSSGKIAQDVYTAAKTSATVVILMGVRKLPEIVRIYKEAGRDSLPIAIIQNGAMPNEKIAVADIQSIENVAKELHIESPAVIVIGEVVSFHADYQKLIRENELINI
ncbi:uroporphyrinogen-III C-methyltransferase [Albibacterium bauzanense]|uniref:uroporphyrinogen-III C-methyltransferase n=1 Tax=Albibacterium bauzanense TaxID=653929 RepID=A0A4R1LUF7_9SPHI|nr:uroporphyrinogen-III C-methyltransferase [Albibacterium bauzanense]TCK82695.1 uroporphyrin-III C-methyltransferase [Albibacterium bauzanense]